MKGYLLFLISLFCLFFSQAQTAFQPSDFLLCDNSFLYDDGEAEFDLETKNSEILQSQNPNNYIVTYHLSSSQANTGTNALSSPYNNVVNPQTVWARVEELSSGDFDTTFFDLVVLDIPIIPDTDLYICDDDGDGEIQLDFDTTENGFDLTYHLTEDDAEQDINALVFPASFLEDDIPFRLYARAESAEGCFYVVQRALYYGSYVEANSLTPYEICGTGGIGTFFLPYKNDEVTGGEPWFVSYHLTQNDAENGLNPLPDFYTNISNPQTIYFRVFNVACSDVTTLDLMVNDGASPQINSLPPQALCPIDPGSVDLTSFETQLINNTSNYEFSYYSTQADMTQDINEIPNPEAFDISADSDKIFVRVTDIASNCYNFSTLDFVFTGACTVPCDDGLNLQYCHTTEDDSFIFTSEDGNPLILEFNSGTFYINGLVPNITVLDSDGSELYVGRGEFIGNQIWDLSGLIFQSSGDTITLEINPVNNSIGCNPDIAGSEIWDIDVYCNSSAGVINVQAFSDSNSNATFDNGETEFTNGFFTYEKNNDGIINEVSSTDGSFFIVSENDTDTYDINFYLYEEYLACYNVTTSSFNDVSASVGQNIQLDVPVTVNQSCEDLGIYLISSELPRPGFNFEMELVYKNNGFVDIPSGTLVFISDLQLDFISVNTNPNYTTTNTGQGFILEFTNLAPGEAISASIVLYCPPSVDLGTIVTSYASYSTNQNDIYIENDYPSLSLEVVGSYDPNDKMESHGPRVLYDSFVVSDEWLYYTIRFQNLGTAVAEFIRIEDVLDTQLNASTFQMLRASHDYVVTRTDSNLEWFFDDINLPAEQDDVEGSKGYVHFRIKPQPGYAINDIIPNTASIFFDFNAPIVTNTFETKFVEDLLSITEYDLIKFEMYPNPSRDILNIKLNVEARISIYDVQGKLILNRDLEETEQQQINVSNLQSGLYFVKLNTNSKELIKKLIIE